MSIQLRTKDLSPVEISFLKWQYGFEEEDDPFERSLWHTILHAWEADRQAFMSNSPGRHLPRDIGRELLAHQHGPLSISRRTSRRLSASASTWSRRR